MSSDRSDDTPLPVLLTRVSGHALALRQEDVAEVLPLPRLTPLPESPPIVDGLFHLGGEAVLVLPLAGLLALAEPAEGDPLYQHLLLLRERSGRPRLALRVDRVTELVRADPNLLPPGDSFNDCVEGDIRLDATLVPLLATSRLLTRYEEARLAAFAARAAMREAAFTVTDRA